MAFLGIFQQIGALYFVGPILLQNIDDIDDSKFWKFHDGVALAPYRHMLVWGSSCATKSARELRFHIQNISQAQAMYQNKH